MLHKVTPDDVTDGNVCALGPEAPDSSHGPPEIFK